MKMKMKAKHTPLKTEPGLYTDSTQIKIVPVNRNDSVYIMVGGRGHITDGFAEFIVRACNCHEELLLTLQAVRDHIPDLLRKVEMTVQHGPWPHNGKGKTTLLEMVVSTLSNAKI